MGVWAYSVLHVRIRALALLIRSFLETAVNLYFIHNLFHEMLFRYHVLGEVSLPDPGFTPYYDNCPLNINLEDHVLMSQVADQPGISFSHTSKSGNPLSGC